MFQQEQYHRGIIIIIIFKNITILMLINMVIFIFFIERTYIIPLQYNVFITTCVYFIK